MDDRIKIKMLKYQAEHGDCVFEAAYPQVSLCRDCPIYKECSAMLRGEAMGDHFDRKAERKKMAQLKLLEIGLLGMV